MSKILRKQIEEHN